MVARIAFGVALTCLVASGGCRAGSRDRDHDGVPDSVEQRLAQELFPVLHVSALERCAEPFDPKPVLFRARHPSFHGVRNDAFIVINYVVLYDADCGDGPHPGDDEPLVVFARRDGSGGYVFDSLAATAHTHTAIELRTSSRNREIWIEANKHAQVAELDRCPGCAGGPAAWRIRLFNVGEPNAPLISDLGSVRARYRGIDPWSPTMPFLGAGVIGAEDLGLKYFTYLTHPPESADARWDDD